MGIACQPSAIDQPREVADIVFGAAARGNLDGDIILCLHGANNPPCDNIEPFSGAKRADLRLYLGGHAVAVHAQ